MSTLADELLGNRPKTTSIAGSSRVHRFDDGENEFAKLKAAILSRVHDCPGPTRKELATVLEADLDDVRIACDVLVKNREIHSEGEGKNYGYHLGPPAGEPESPKEGEAMPRVKAATATIGDTPNVDEKPPKRKYTKRKLAKRATNGHRTPAPRIPPNGLASFAVNDAGCVTIVQGDAHLELDLGNTKRLAIFIERTKSFRP